MEYKFEKLEVWKLALSFNEVVYEIAEVLPEKEKFNLAAQMRRASTSIALNIAEGSTSQSNAEQARFLSFAIRSLIEVIACLKLIDSRAYMTGRDDLKNRCHKLASILFIKLQAFRNALK